MAATSRPPLRSPVDEWTIEISRASEGERTYPDWHDGDALRRAFDEDGYVVARCAIPGQFCDRARTEFWQQVLPSRRPLYRQASAMPERHVLDDRGRMLNSILNVQDLPSRHFGAFRKLGLDVLTHPRLRSALSAILDDQPKLVQSMYFEGNPATWAHRDTFYLDSSRLGTLVGAWVALEDIRPGAGRFFVVPGSHRSRLIEDDPALGIASSHELYKSRILEQVRDEGLSGRAPALRKGDVLIWSSLTIHGSLPTTDESASRSSFTGHFIADADDFVQYRKSPKALSLRVVNGMRVNYPKDQDLWKNRVVLEVAARFPRAFGLAKRVALRLRGN